MSKPLDEYTIYIGASNRATWGETSYTIGELMELTKQATDITPPQYGPPIADKIRANLQELLEYTFFDQCRNVVCFRCNNALFKELFPDFENLYNLQLDEIDKEKYDNLKFTPSEELLRFESADSRIWGEIETAAWDIAMGKMKTTSELPLQQLREKVGSIDSFLSVYDELKRVDETLSKGKRIIFMCTDKQDDPYDPWDD